MPGLLVLLAVLARVRGAGQGRLGTFLLVLVLLRLLFFLVATHLTFRHSDLQTLDGRLAQRSPSARTAKPPLVSLMREREEHPQPGGCRKRHRDGDGVRPPIVGHSNGHAW